MSQNSLGRLFFVKLYYEEATKTTPHYGQATHLKVVPAFIPAGQGSCIPFLEKPNQSVDCE